MVQRLLKVRGADDDGAEEAMKDTWTAGAADGGAVGEAGGDVKEVWEEPAEIDYEGTPLLPPQFSCPFFVCLNTLLFTVPRTPRRV